MFSFLCIFSVIRKACFKKEFFLNPRESSNKNETRAVKVHKKLSLQDFLIKTPFQSHLVKVFCENMK